MLRDSRAFIRPLLVLIPAAILAVSAAGSPASAAPPDHAFAHGQRALTRLGDRLPSVAARHGLTAAELRRLLLADPTLGIDRRLGLAYVDEPEPAVGAAARGGEDALPSNDGPPFELASLPGATKTIYLDFTGHVTQSTGWNTAYNLPTIESPAFDLDGDPSTFSATELQRVSEVWQTVAEDFAPFNVNVTTIDPGVEALRRSGTGDETWGVRVVLTKDTFSACGCGGKAYVGSFDDSIDTPAWVFNTSARGAGDAASHEAGHTLGLAHDGLTNGTTYYAGHGSGATGWAPIMGSSYTRNLAQWSRQEYTGANNNDAAANYGAGPDDLAIIASMTNGNNFGYRPDDHGDTASSATDLATLPSTFLATIGTRSDVDAFSFTTSGGSVSLTATPQRGDYGNLDIGMTVLRSDGTQVATINSPTSVFAVWNGTLPAGTYTVLLDGVGLGDPSASPPTGYSDYATIGRYFFLSSYPTGTPDTTAPQAPTGLVAAVNGANIELSWTANSESDLAGYRLSRASSLGGPFTVLASPSAAATGAVDSTPLTGTNAYVLTAVDEAGNESAASAPVAVTFTPTVPVSVATSEKRVAGTVTGTFAATQSADGVVERITEVDASGKLSSRTTYDLLEHRWAIPATTGSQSLRIIASTTDGGDADSGFRLEWSKNGKTWTSLATLNGPATERTFPIGNVTGTVWVRVVDTNRSRGQRGHDSILVDLLRLEGNSTTSAPEKPRGR